MNNLSSNHGALVDGLNRAVLPCHKWNPYNTTSHSGRDGLPRTVIDRAGNVSWKALDWATDSQVGSSTTKFILLLLANKADENFSCYPSIRTLMAESDAGRSTVMRALNELEASGFTTRQPQFHDSGARRSSRYYPKHPLAPHCSPRPNPGSPRPDSTRAPSECGTGPVSERHPTGVPNWAPLNPPSEPPTQPPADATSVLRAMPQPWRVRGKDARNLTPAIEAVLASGWTTENLTRHLSRNPAASESRRESWLDVSRIYPTHRQDLAPLRRGAANAKTSGHARSP